MEAHRPCPQCGQEIPPEHKTCPRCAEVGGWWTLPRDTVLLLSFPVLVLFFVVTGFAARFYHAKQRALAEEWYVRGEADLKGGRAPQAIEDLHTALVYSRDNTLFRQRLAQALIAADRRDEARVYLLNLWEREPGDGTVNLELARLAVHKGNFGDAVRYFHNAIFGVWEENPEQQRRKVRLELCEFLLSRGARREAQAALIELAGDLPKDPRLYTHVGSLFLRAEDYNRALAIFRQALQLERRQPAALAGAGEAAFQMANYRDARRYLEQAVRADPENQRASQLLETARTVLNVDPFRRGLSSAERARRAVQAFQQGLERLRKCSQTRAEALEGPQPMTELQVIYARAADMRPRIRERTLRRDSGLLMSAMDLVFDIEEFAARACGSPTGTDLALLLVARQHGGAEP